LHIWIDTVQLFFFDNATGIVFNPLTLPIGAHCYGLEFSPNSSKLYVSTYDELGTLVQYNLDVLDEDSIRASKTALSVLPDTYGIQLGSDGKIYVCRAWSQYLGLVNLPDLPGFACNYDNFGFDLDPNFNGVMSALSLPGFVTSWLVKKGECIVTTVSSLHEDDDAGFNIYPNPAGANFTFELNSKFYLENAAMRIYDVLGNEVFNQVLKSNSHILPFHLQLTKGMYFVKLNMTDNRNITTKLIID
jgi:hypothetical protein